MLVINTTTYHLGQYILHLLLLKSSMSYLSRKLKCSLFLTIVMILLIQYWFSSIQILQMVKLILYSATYLFFSTITSCSNGPAYIFHQCTNGQAYQIACYSEKIFCNQMWWNQLVGLEFFHFSLFDLFSHSSLVTAKPTVWPDGVQSRQNASKCCPNSSHTSFYIQWSFTKYPKKSPIFWATFVRKFVTKSFQKSPNLVTLKASQISFLYALGPFVQTFKMI